MKYTFFTNSERAWKSMFDAVGLAKKSIYLEMYIFKNDMDRFNFFNLLKSKAKEGIQVKLILDSFGSISLSNNSVLELKESGAEVLFLSYLRHRMHRKVLIVDEAVAFLGGVNLHQTARLWNDLVVKIKGPLVRQLVMSFIKSYTHAFGKDLSLLNRVQSKKILFKKVRSWLVEHSPVRNNFNLKDAYRKHIDKAEKNIILVTPYFIPKRWLSALLHQAVLREVKVDILVPRNTDHFLIDRVNYFYMYRMSKLGINFYLEPDMNHAKLMILDGKEGMVGSQNLDFLSFELNSEIGVFFNEKEVVDRLSVISQSWQKNSVLFNIETYKPRWFDYLLSPFINLFSKIFW